MPTKANSRSKPNPKRRRPTPGSTATENHDAKAMAIYLAMAVRNAMEGFHTEHLSDAQMRELNPIIRNALYTALVAMGSDKPAARMYVDFQMRLIPDYWEAPELTEEYLLLEKQVGPGLDFPADLE